MKHNKLEKLTFFKYIQGKFNNKYLDKIVEKLESNVSHPQRQSINKLIYAVNKGISEKDAKLICLIYCLHIAKPKDGYIDMVIKDLISETDIDVSEKEISFINELLRNVVDSLDLPELKMDRTLAKNIAVYSEDFRKKYERFIQN